MADAITQLLVQRRGHFQLESGHHSPAWFELDRLFDRADELAPFVTELARRLASHGVDAVCGPMSGGAKLARLIATELRIECFEAERLETPGATGLFAVRYELSETQRRNARARSVAIVDDAISAGSAVRATYADLVAHSARPVALGALIVFGDAAAHFAADRGLPLEATLRMPLEIWHPGECPLCRAGVAIERVSAA